MSKAMKNVNNNEELVKQFFGGNIPGSIFRGGEFNFPREIFFGVEFFGSFFSGGIFPDTGYDNWSNVFTKNTWLISIKLCWVS